MKEIIQHISNNYDFYLDIAQKIAKSKETGQDLLHSIIIYISDRYNKEKFHHALDGGYLMYLIIAVMKVEYYSKSSYFWRDSRRESSTKLELFIEGEECENDLAIENFEYRNYIDAHLDVITKVIEEEFPGKEGMYKKILFKEYHYRQTPTSYMKMQKSTRIPSTTIFQCVTEVMEIVKEKLKNYNNERF